MTKETIDARRALAAEILAASGADVSQQVEIYPLAKQMQTQGNIKNLDICKHYIARAIRRARWDAMPESERPQYFQGGKRPGAGRKKVAQ